MALILGIDTGGDACAVAVLRDDAVFASASRAMSRGHAEALVPMVLAAVAEAGVAIADIDTIGVTVGPGSFTGLRTGIAAARGFALAAGARAVGVSSLEAVGCAAFAEWPDAARVVAVLETRRRDFFVQPFGPGGDPRPAPLAAPAVREAEAVAAMLADGDVLAGDAVARLVREAGSALAGGGGQACPGTPPPDVVARLAARIRAAAGDEKLLEPTLSPLYLRAPEAKLPDNGGRLRR